jgi:hypothetical protein
MEKNPLNKGILTANAKGVGGVTREMVQARARELALLAGHTPPQVRQSDYEQAKRELTGEADIDRQDAVLDALPETKRGDPIPSSASRQVPESPSEDEDSEGRSETEQLVEEGAEEAERDRMFQAARAAAKTDAREP